MRAANVATVACIDATVLDVRSIPPTVASLVGVRWSSLIVRRGAEIMTLPRYRNSSVASVGGRLLRSRGPAGGLAGGGIVIFRGELTALAVGRASGPARVLVRVPIGFEQAALTARLVARGGSSEE